MLLGAAQRETLCLHAQQDSSSLSEVREVELRARRLLEQSRFSVLTACLNREPALLSWEFGKEKTNVQPNSMLPYIHSFPEL